MTERRAQRYDDPTVRARVRKVLKHHGRLRRDADRLSRRADLYEAGMSTHASVNVMLALEHEFDLEFPEQMLSGSTFESIDTITSAIVRIGAG